MCRRDGKHVVDGDGNAPTEKPRPMPVVNERSFSMDNLSFVRRMPFPPLKSDGAGSYQHYAHRWGSTFTVHPC